MSLKFEIKIETDHSFKHIVYKRHGRPHRDNAPANVSTDGNMLAGYRYGKRYYQCDNL